VREITVASYNIQHGVGLDFRQDIGRTVRVLCDVGADVIALQEVVVAPDGGRADQAQFIASSLGMNLVMGITRPHGRGSFGNAILTRLPVSHVERCDLSVRGREPRLCQRADVALEGRTLSIYCAHFGLGPGERRRQLDRLRTFLRASHARRGSRVLMGDFNELHRGPITRTLWREFTTLEPRQVRSHPALAPLLSLDRIYWDAELSGDGPRAHRTKWSRLASDHLPLVAKLRVETRSVCLAP